MKLKMNALLGKTDALEPYWKGMLQDFIGFFKNSQGAFKGEKKTYTAREGTMDVPANRNLVKVQTTVDEKLVYLKEHTAEYINALFAQEATNASGNVKADLILDGNVVANLSSLELLRLKSLLDTQAFKTMHEGIVVRSDGEVWNAATDADYSNRGVFESPLITRVEKTTEKESYILPDPNVDKNSASYKPTIAHKTTTIELGDATSQKFSGEWTQARKAEVLTNIAKLRVAVIEALKRANEAESVDSNMNAELFFSLVYATKS